MWQGNSRTLCHFYGQALLCKILVIYKATQFPFKRFFLSIWYAKRFLVNCRVRILSKSLRHVFSYILHRVLSFWKHSSNVVYFHYYEAIIQMTSSCESVVTCCDTKAQAQPLCHVDELSINDVCVFKLYHVLQLSSLKWLLPLHLTTQVLDVYIVCLSVGTIQIHVVV